MNLTDGSTIGHPLAAACYDGRHRAPPRVAFLLLCLTFILLRSYEPLLSDVRVGNVSVWQLFALAALLGLTEYLGRPDLLKRRIALGTGLLSGLALLTLLKPNIALITLLMALQLGASHGGRTFFRCALGAAGASIVFVIVPCVYFGTPAVWLDWYRYVFGPAKGIVGWSVQQADSSTVTIASEWLQVNAPVLVVCLGALLASSLALALWKSGRAGGRVAGIPGTWAEAMRRLAGDPSRMASIGVIATIAMAPLVWLHYYMLMLIPALWLTRVVPSIDRVGVLSAIALLMASGALSLFLFLARLDGTVPTVFALSWVPLWAAMLLEVAGRSAGAGAPVVVVASERKGKAGRAGQPAARGR